MSYSYAFVRLGEGKEPFPLDKKGRAPKEQAEFLMKEKNMVGYILGGCLDSCRWGSQTTVMYEMSIKDMIDFIQNWTEQNEGNFESLFHEKRIDGLYERFELPYIDYDVCPNNKEHKERMRDMGGRVRCGHRKIIKLKPSFVESYSYFDEHSKMRRLNFHESSPHDPLPSDPYDENGDLEDHWKEPLKKYEEEMEKFENEKPTEEIMDLCYAILSDRGTILSLEETIRRLNLRPEFVTVYCPDDGSDSIVGIDRKCTPERIAIMSEKERENYEGLGHCPGHLEPHDKIEFSFDGWDLAFYVQKWWEQLDGGNAPWYDK